MFTELYPITYYFYPLLPHDKRKQDILDPGMRNLQSVFLKPSIHQAPGLLYIHIPYCHDICQFCPFHVRVDNDESIYQTYTDYLCKEMALLAQQPYIKNMPFSAVYFGGGSPSIFPASQLKQIFQTMNLLFNILPDAEISFEGEPKTLGDPQRLDLLKQFNVSRISFGLQTYDEDIRQLFKIKATLADIENVKINAKQRDFKDINVDMMYDLPGQDLQTLEQDMQKLLADGFDSVDYYNLHYFAFPKKFKLDMENGKIPAKPDAQMHMALTQRVTEFMTDNGYNHVADQVFSRHPQVCEYFKLLWGGGYGEHRAQTVAVGASARGYLDGYSYINRSNIRDYYAFIDKQTLPLQKVSDRLTEAANRGAAFFLKFFSLDKIHKQALATIPPFLLQSWKADGLIYETSDAIRLSPKGKLWIPNMMVDLFEPEQKLLATGSKDLLTQKQGSRTGSF